MREVHVKPGDLIEITWLDACAYMNGSDISKEVFKQGGEELYLVGVLVARNNRSVVICDELDENRLPHRDFNLIPRRMITNIKLLKRGYANVAEK